MKYKIKTIKLEKELILEEEKIDTNNIERINLNGVFFYRGVGEIKSKDNTWGWQQEKVIKKEY